MTSNTVQRTASRGGTVKTFGWIMNWKPFRAVDGKKMGEEFTIKTIFKKKVGFEDVSIYIGNVLVKDLVLIERIHDMKGPVPVLVEGVKKGEHVYNNVHKNEIEGTKKLCWIYLNARGMKLNIVNEIPPEVVKKYGLISPVITFKDFSTRRAAERRKLAKAPASPRHDK